MTCQAITPGTAAPSSVTIAPFRRPAPMSSRLGGCDEHRRAIGRAAIAELAAVVGGVHQLPVLVEQEGVVELGGVVGDAHRLVVTARLARHVAIGRAIDMAAGVAALDLHHAGN